jgi:hypothetical protein
MQIQPEDSFVNLGVCTKLTVLCPFDKPMQHQRGAHELKGKLLDPGWQYIYVPREIMR